MSVIGWRYYNHAAIPTTAPHEEVNIEPLKNGSIWQVEGGIPLLARWITEWDCNYETEWWYCIKDTPFNMSDLKAKRRYEINKGNKNFTIQTINPREYIDILYQVTVSAYESWPAKYRPHINKRDFLLNIDGWEKLCVFGAFDKENNTLRGYALLNDYGTYVEFSILRVDPDFEKYGINAAMVAGILDYYEERFNGHFYINDGSRSIRHETAFQDYLEKYFGFRKAYCRLNIKYRIGVGLLINILYPFRNKISTNNKIGSLIGGLLKMEEIRRD